MTSWWIFHTIGDAHCAACVLSPTTCEECSGLVHTHFGDELDALEAHCDKCSLERTPLLLEVD